jgi:hypothetical protein
MTVHLLDPRIHAKKARLRKLLGLRSQVDAEIAALRVELFGPEREPYGPRPEKPACGTEAGYHWHRHQYRKHGLGKWPLPKSDPCGCKAAHRAHAYAYSGPERRRNQRLAREQNEA